MQLTRETFLQHLQDRIGEKLSERGTHVSTWLEGRLLEIREDGFDVEFVVREEMTNPLGLFHGGMQAAILDEVIGLTAYATDPEARYVSINLTIDFLGSAKTGDKVVAKSRLIRQGRQILNAQCELFDATGKLISRGLSNMFRSAKSRSE
jgi:acyl-coenzyme A thioesterase 13